MFYFGLQQLVQGLKNLITKPATVKKVHLIHYYIITPGFTAMKKDNMILIKVSCTVSRSFSERTKGWIVHGLIKLLAERQPHSLHWLLVLRVRLEPQASLVAVYNIYNFKINKSGSYGQRPRSIWCVSGSSTYMSQKSHVNQLDFMNTGAILK